MKTEQNYTGLMVGSPASAPTSVSLFINGTLYRKIDLWETNLTGKQVRKAYEIEKKNLEGFIDDLKIKIGQKIKEQFPKRRIIFDDDFVFTGKTSAQWGGDGRDYEGIPYYLSTPSPSHKDSPMIVRWTFRTEKGNQS